MIGLRVRLARETCKFTQKELAELSGVPIGTLSSIESGRTQNPSDEFIERFAAATSFPHSFFKLGPLPDVPDGHFRRLKKGRAKDTKRVRAQVRLISEIVQRADRELNLPLVTIRPISHRESRIDLLDIEDMATELRGYIGVDDHSPLSNVIRAAERSGVIVARLPNDFPDHDGYSVWPDQGLDGRPIIAISSGCPGDRDRASVAHEIAHLFLHTVRSRLDYDVAEREAWLLAGAILLPKSAAESLFKPPVTLRVLLAAKAAYGVSVGLAAQRALDLSLITRPHFVSIRKQMSSRGWNRSEPGKVPSEKPVLIKKIVERLAGTGSVRERADRLHTHYFLVSALASSIVILFVIPISVR